MQPSVSSTHDPPIDLSQCLYTDAGEVHLHIPDGVLPACVIEAFNAAVSGRLTEAREHLDREGVACARQLDQVGYGGADLVCLVLAMTFRKLGESAEAVQWYERVISSQGHVLVYNELATICQELGQFEQAAAYRQCALKEDPENPHLWSGYAVDQMAMGRLEEGIALMRKAVCMNESDAMMHSRLLFFMHYLPDQDRESMLAEHKRWAQCHAPLHLARAFHDNDPHPHRCLRIGYISADFKQHSVTYNFEAILDGHTPGAVENIGYGHVKHPDHVTERLKQKFDDYRDIRKLNDVDLANLIIRDRIDILVQIAGHGSDHRLCMMARKPAPIQVDFQGINTTGMTQVDYRLTDRLLDPPGSEQYYVETSVYLPGGLNCFTPPTWAPDIGSLPALRNGYITFGAFHGSLKINAYTVSLWAQVLRTIPNARLLIKCPGGADRTLNRRYLVWFKEMGVTPERLEFHGWKPLTEHFQLYNEIDIALDTYPYNGCINTLEGLWMGVPMISLAGQTWVSREGCTLLNHSGLGYFATTHPDQFVARAVALAHNRDSLAKIRSIMRERLMSSPLFDAHRFACEVEGAYRWMWHQWCQGK